MDSSYWSDRAPFSDEARIRADLTLPPVIDANTRLLEIRKAAEKAMGTKFNVQKFHDFILSQGLLPPNLLRKAVMEGYVRNQ